MKLTRLTHKHGFYYNAYENIPHVGLYRKWRIYVSCVSGKEIKERFDLYKEGYVYYAGIEVLVVMIWSRIWVST